MLSVNPYLNFMGNTEDAFNFYKSVFGGEFTTFQRFKDIPGGDKMSPADQQKIMHVALPIGNTGYLMATDALESMGHTLTAGNNFYVTVYTDNEAEAERIFPAISEGGTIEMPLNKTFWGAYFGMCKDKFGIQWMINYQHEK